MADSKEQMIEPKKLEATVLADPTTSNLGPLFDVGGARLNGRQYGLYMEATGYWKKEPGLSLENYGQYPLHNDDRLADKVAAAMFREKELKGGLRVVIKNNMKPGGLGTSGARAIAIVEIINALYGLNLTDREKIRYASLGETDEHLDNVVPGVIGGIVISSRIDGQPLPRYSKIQYSKIQTPATITPSLIVPLTISKGGGTAAARMVLDGLVYDRNEAVRLTALSQLMAAGLREDDFTKVRDSIADYSGWEKSVTFVRNHAGVYQVDVHDINRRLEQILGREAIITPSGAGTALLGLAADPAVGHRQRIAAERIFRDLNKPAAVFETPFF